MTARRISATLILGLLIFFAVVAAASSRRSRETEDIPGHGFDVANLDRTCKPCEDFYQFAVGGWLKSNWRD